MRWTASSEPEPVLAGIGDEAAPALPDQLAAVRELGWNRLELRTLDGTPMADLSETAFARAAEEIRASGVEVVAVAAKIGDWSRPATGDFTVDLAELDVLARRCAVLGVRTVRIMSYPSGGLTEPVWGRTVRARVGELARRAEDAGLVLAHENCAGWAGERADRALDLIAHVDSPALRILFDVGNGVAHGYDAAAMLRPLVEYVTHVHVKDAVRTPDGDTAYVPPGEGGAGVEECLRVLADHGYRGALSIEPHLHLRPHLRADGGDPGRGDRAAFVEYGRVLEELVRRVRHTRTDAEAVR
ncbi:sugar phosphate isomerase/epimerase [Nocardiopsis sp. N85]|uniref:sugar phosphate isomerase/epimerase family protein n=1 Tax=Nocardiopsis sp. N85 TaxID=3029400 RepID=UPI00237FC0D4|nr:sugar phosphate isomerase/epimerase family protein [Nocardiopsis sp. N85]MDE3724136.1 sugar phosphate isomerase/epimerase [Nocardiopsis sp. N85]